MFKISSITLVAVLTLGASAQAQTQTQVPADSGNPTPTYRINVVSRTTRAVSYKHPINTAVEPLRSIFKAPI